MCRRGDVGGEGDGRSQVIVGEATSKRGEYGARGRVSARAVSGEEGSVREARSEQGDALLASRGECASEGCRRRALEEERSELARGRVTVVAVVGVEAGCSGMRMDDVEVEEEKERETKRAINRTTLGWTIQPCLPSLSRGAGRIHTLDRLSSRLERRRSPFLSATPPRHPSQHPATRRTPSWTFCAI
ncbi:hypothetical protein AcW1_001479 [Taiwanofungus camphoratus]|nr:hypothetical protein AcW1_001479 [Antrodia cinnamomea]